MKYSATFKQGTGFQSLVSLKDQSIFGLHEDVCGTRCQGNRRRHIHLCDLLFRQCEANRYLEDRCLQAFVYCQWVRGFDGVGGHCLCVRCRHEDRDELHGYSGALCLVVNHLINMLPGVRAPIQVVSSEIHVVASFCQDPILVCLPSVRYSLTKPGGKAVAAGAGDESSAGALLYPGGFVFEMSEPWVSTLMKLRPTSTILKNETTYS